MNIKIDYNGAWPNLCSGDLVVTIDDVIWKFPSGCLISGGSVTFDENWSEIVTDGDWIIDAWPDNFPQKLRGAVLIAVNEQIPHGCCGGCV